MRTKSYEDLLSAKVIHSLSDSTPELQDIIQSEEPGIDQGRKRRYWDEKMRMSTTLIYMMILVHFFPLSNPTWKKTSWYLEFIKLDWKIIAWKSLSYHITDLTQWSDIFILLALILNFISKVADFFFNLFTNFCCCFFFSLLKKIKLRQLALEVDFLRHCFYNIYLRHFSFYVSTNYWWKGQSYALIGSEQCIHEERKIRVLFSEFLSK